MRTPGFFCCLASLLLAAPALAQKAPKAPPTLLGHWRTSQIRFDVQHALPDSTLAKLDDPAISDLNQAIFVGAAHLDVEFRADSTYAFTIERDGQLVRTETGTYSLRGTHLLASAPASPDGSSFHDQQVQRLARRGLTLTFPMGPEFPGVSEEVEYRRVGPYPDKN